MNPYYESWIGQWCLAWRPGALSPLQIYITRLLAIGSDGADFGSEPKTPLNRVEGTFIGSCWRHRTDIDQWAEVFDLAEDTESGAISEVVIYQHSEAWIDKRRLAIAEFLASFDFKSGGGL